MTNYPLPLQCESCGILIAHFDLTEHFFTELMQCLFNGCSYRSICRISMSLHFNQHLHGKKVTMFEYEIIIRHRYKLLYMDPSRFYGICTTCSLIFDEFADLLVHLLNCNNSINQHIGYIKDVMSDTKLSQSLIISTDQLFQNAEMIEPIGFVYQLPTHKFIIKWSNEYVTIVTSESFWNLESSIRDRLSSFFNDQTFMIKVYKQDPTQTGLSF